MSSFLILTHFSRFARRSRPRVRIVLECRGVALWV